MRKLLSCFIIFIFCLMYCASCKRNSKDMMVYRNFYEQDVSTFNYIITNIHSDYTHIANFVDGLVENDKYGNIVPSIAKSWKEEIINDKHVWTFYLRDDSYWSDYKGNKYSLVTAHDFVTTMKYILNYNIGSNNYSLPASLIDNALNYYNATMIYNYDYDYVVNEINKLKQNDPNNQLSIYLNIKEAFDYCSINNCSNDFSKVGIKAINDFELQFILSSPIPYFLSSLTYCPFLPSNETFIKEVGIDNFGTNKKTLLYNGAYILKDYYHSSKIEYVKNYNYWDKDNVYIDKIIFNKLLTYPTNNYTRLTYETGNIDEFYVNEYDKVGWDKYVLGKKGSGSATNPVGNNTYAVEEITDFTNYYMVFNQNRTTNKYSTLTNREISISNLALSNTNFRKALLYGLEKNSYYGLSYSKQSTSLVPKKFIDYNGIDYNDYYIEEYAERNSISFQEASNLLNNEFLFDKSKSQYYLNLALNELAIDKEDLPIKLEYSYYYSQDYINYDLERIKLWNNTLNGCDTDSLNCSYDKILITYNDTLTSYLDFSEALTGGEYSISIVGLYPNFIDPTTYLEAFSRSGELFPFLNHNNTNIIKEKLDDIALNYSNESIENRFKLCAKLEYEIIYELALAIPLFMKDFTNKVSVSNLIPFQKMKASYGLCPFKFKFRKLRSQNYTQEDILKLKEEYEKGRKTP